jgi:hypothetical protein
MIRGSQPVETQTDPFKIVAIPDFFLDRIGYTDLLPNVHDLPGRPNRSDFVSIIQVVV